MSSQSCIHTNVSIAVFQLAPSVKLHRGNPERSYELVHGEGPMYTPCVETLSSTKIRPDVYLKPIERSVTSDRRTGIHEILAPDRRCPHGSVCLVKEIPRLTRNPTNTANSAGRLELRCSR